MKKEGGWIFISHSHQDIKIVRKIRNRFEELGYEPLMFYLKCLNDHDEIEDLIKREIDEREWFVYVDSHNARASDWVKSEREYIAGQKDKKIITIDIGGDVLKQVDSIAKNLKVFISHKRKDSALAEKIKNILIQKDYLVLSEDSLDIEQSFSESISGQISSAAKDGFFLALITEGISSSWIEQEIMTALNCGAKIIPVYVDNATLSFDIHTAIGDLQGVHISSNPSEEELLDIVLKIEHQVSFYKSDFSISAGFTNATVIKYPYIASIPEYTFCDCDNLKKVIIPNCVTYISDKAFSKEQDVLILCEKNSYTEGFCIEYGLRYEIIDSFENYKI